MTLSPAAVHDDRRLPALTGLRFAAAAAVVLAHATEQGLLTSTRGLVDALDGGRTAVSLFFVLSGFVLAYNYRDMAGSAARRAFWVARLARIYPLVLLALAVSTIGVAYAWLHRGQGVLYDWYYVDHHAVAVLGISFLAQLTATVAWLPSGGVASAWNAPEWSIGVEVLFYALFPLLIVVARRMRTRTLLLVTGAAWVAQGLWLAALQLALPETTMRILLVHQFPLSHLFEFVAGITAALLFGRGLDTWIGQGHRRALAVGGATAVLVVLSVWQPVQPAHFLMDPFFAVLVLGLAAPGRARLLGSPLVVRLGEASFALYLLHVPLLFTLRATGYQGGQLLTLLVLLGIVGLSVAVFQWFESPARRRIRARFTPRAANSAEKANQHGPEVPTGA